MTDFLGRVAARAVGAAAVAQPRLPGLFEPPGRSDVDVHQHHPAYTASEATLEVSDDEVVVRRPASPRREDGVPAPPPSAPPPPVAATAVADDAGQGIELVESRPPESPAPAPAREEVVAVATPAPAAVAAPRAAAVAAPFAQAVAAPRVEVPSNSLSLGSAPSARAEPPPVRVHIGRLEVRANVHEPPREQPRRERSRPDEGLSLADYLRGKREAGA